MKENPMCGLWHCNVAVSNYNNNGQCKCIGCFGQSCHTCSTYKNLAEQAVSVLAKTQCQKCQTYKEKTR